MSNLELSKRLSCQRCNKIAYQQERTAPINGVVFHRACFRCSRCGQQLTLRTYYTNQAEYGDKEVYCERHQPKHTAYGLDASAMGIRFALQNFRVKRSGKNRGVPLIGTDAILIKHPLGVQNNLQNKYQTFSRHHFNPLFSVDGIRKRLLDAQIELEKKHAKDESKLQAKFFKRRQEELAAVDQEMKGKYQEAMNELKERLKKTSSKAEKAGNGDDEGRISSKDELQVSHSVQLNEKIKQMTIRLRKKEQQETAEMVAEQSRQMLALVREQQQDAINLYGTESDEQLGGVEAGAGEGEELAVTDVLEQSSSSLVLPPVLPPPHPPNCRRRDLFQDPSIFAELDEYVDQIAQKEHTTWTDLVNELTAHVLDDLGKARAIYRWITVKDLNAVEFEESLKSDTPHSLLSGIKSGSESYHTLFARICSYAGLACVEVKGHSKSVGYEPGLVIKEGSFTNTWNAVLIGNHWWPVHCNWGARHLVSDLQDGKLKLSGPGKVKYQYNEHYFLTDPDEFIYEFIADNPPWQLLAQAITLDQFIRLPIIRSVFFTYGLEFVNHAQEAIIEADKNGGFQISIAVPVEYQDDLAFQCKLSFADGGRKHWTEYNGIALERFVFQTFADGAAQFNVHVPAEGKYYFEVFANSFSEMKRTSVNADDSVASSRLLRACKFRIQCSAINVKMHPLPNCAQGEWGTQRAIRHFGIRPLTHTGGMINAEESTTIKFAIPSDAFVFICKLRANSVDVNLDDFVSSHVQHGELYVNIIGPRQGQFGLDIYVKLSKDREELKHVCKFLLNFTASKDKLTELIKRVESQLTPQTESGPLVLGPSAYCEQLALKCVSHKDATIRADKTGVVAIEFVYKTPVALQCQLTDDQLDDYSSYIKITENNKKLRLLLTATLPHAGTYVLALITRQNNKDIPVYNFLVQYYV